jgi:hypothetical protein
MQKRNLFRKQIDGSLWTMLILNKGQGIKERTGRMALSPKQKPPAATPTHHKSLDESIN